MRTTSYYRDYKAIQQRFRLFVSIIFSHAIYSRVTFIILGFFGILIFCIALCSTFFPFRMNDNSFLLLPLSLSIAFVSIFSLFLSITYKSYFRFLFVDFLFVSLVIYYASRYDYELQLANWKIIYAFLLVLLWFAVRILFSSSINFKSFFDSSFVGVGCIFAVWGLLQLYGICDSNHVLFSITGPFYNPGPYSGYIAMILPVCLYRLLLSKGNGRYFWGTALFLMLSIVPAGMSRSAWLAILVSCLWLLAIHLNWVNKIKKYGKKKKNIVRLYSFLAFITLSLLFIFFFQIKSDSANGRLFIWKKTLTAILERPVFGYGAGSFPSVYGESQAAYFAFGEYTKLEEHVAGSPEYAFNECLQMCVEGGVLLLVVALLLLVLAFKKGMQTKKHGACAGLLSLFVFSLSSYPFQILPFGVAGVFLLAICVSGQEKILLFNKKSLLWIFLFPFILSLGSGGVSYSLCHLKEIDERWYYTDILRSKTTCDAAIVGYGRLYDKLKHNPTFLLNYAKSLSAQKRFDEANAILERAKRVCNNPMLCNIQGRNYQIMGNFVTAEVCFKESIQLLPGRIYPYYLLAKLYMEPDFLDVEKAKQMANIVLTKPPKVYSNAIDEMCAEMKVLLDELYFIN